MCNLFKSLKTEITTGGNKIHLVPHSKHSPCSLKRPVSSCRLVISADCENCTQYMYTYEYKRTYTVW